jgi:hypothetical protein
VKAHVKQHKVSSLKLVPLLPNRNNPEEDSFVVVPKNALAKGVLTSSGSTAPVTPSKSKAATAAAAMRDTFQPADWDKVPSKPHIYRQLMRCAACDFSTKVRLNLIKHLKLHLVKSKLGKSADPVFPFTVQGQL